MPDYQLVAINMVGNKFKLSPKTCLGRLALVLLVSCGTIVSASNLTLTAPRSVEPYRFVIDAGSSGSRLYVYHGTENIPLQNAKVRPGISSYKDSPHDAAKSLQPLFELAEKTIRNLPIPPAQKPPLVVYATAGMRTLDEGQQRSIYDAIEASSIKYHTLTLEDARTISGQEEAVYAWVAINLLKGTLDTAGTQAVNQDTVGSMELGGASMQVAYEVPNDYRRGPIDKSDLVTLQINNRPIYLFAKSYLGLGQNLTAKAMPNSAGCLPQGYSSNLAFNAATCRAALTSHINDITRKQGNMPKLPESTQFVAISGFHYLQDFFTPNNSGSFKTVIEGGVCKQSWEKLRQQYPSADEDYLPYYCMTGVYASTLFDNLFKLDENTQQVAFKNKINGEEITWTKGAAYFLKY